MTFQSNLSRFSGSEQWKPRPDQQRTLDLWGDRRRGAIWAGTGTGKTAIAATILSNWMLDRCEVDRALIVAPRLVVQQWPHEFSKWEHLAPLVPLTHALTFADLDLTPAVRDGRRGELTFRDRKATKRRLLAVAEKHRAIVCSWDAFPHLEDALGRAWPFDALVLDESSFVRDPMSARGKAARRAVHKSGRVNFLIELTATPAANKIEALRAQLDLIEPGCMGRTLTEFRDVWCVPATRDWATGRVFSWRLSKHWWPAVEKVIGRLAVRVPDTLGVDLLVSETPVYLPDDVLREMRDLEHDSVLEGVTAASAAVMHAKLRQMAAGAVYLDAVGECGPVREYHSAKIDRLRELMDETDDEPLLVLYNWVFEQDMLRREFGDRFADIRDAGAMRRFTEGRLRLLGLHPASAGHGVDGLQHVCRRAVWLSVPEDAELFAQANGRLRRGGQARTVVVHVLVAVGTREAQVWNASLPAKSLTQDRVLAGAAA